MLYLYSPFHPSLPEGLQVSPFSSVATSHDLSHWESNDEWLKEEVYPHGHRSGLPWNGHWGSSSKKKKLFGQQMVHRKACLIRSIITCKHNIVLTTRFGIFMWGWRGGGVHPQPPPLHPPSGSTPAVLIPICMNMNSMFGILIMTMFEAGLFITFFSSNYKYLFLLLKLRWLIYFALFIASLCI